MRICVYTKSWKKQSEQGVAEQKKTHNFEECLHEQTDGANSKIPFFTANCILTE